MLRVIFQDQFLPGQAQVPQKTLSQLKAADDKPCISRIKRLRIVAPPLAKLLAEIPCPVLCSHFPAINVQHCPSDAGFSRADLLQQFADVIIELIIESAAGEFVTFESIAGLWRRAGIGPIIAADKSHDCPIPGGYFPIQRSIRSKPISQIDDHVPIYTRRLGRRRILGRCRQIGFDTLYRREGRTIIQGLLISRLDLYVRFERWIRQYRHVLEVSLSFFLQFFCNGRKIRAARLRNRQSLIEVDRPFNFDRTSH